jgi:hypothetical protein
VTTQQPRHHPFPSTTGLALLCAGVLFADCASAKKPHAPRPASAPTTAQILAPSVATVPDALPPDRLVYRCGSSYSSLPCDAAQKPLDVADARSEAQRRQSEDLTVRDKRLAAWYEAGRREREKLPSSPVSGRPASAAAPVCTSTTMMTCVPKKPRKRTVSVHGATNAVFGGKAND